ncbi:hypothetical protein [Robiginitomaculum antarcticum]|uniref:hypothetical protein n=1 Tax=Robiginitomaculum antarcticum TaxID=437507 RepID=UPI000371224C|nr:hypothetical protein [Robiginitomaculum antarcticum]
MKIKMIIAATTAVLFFTSQPALAGSEAGTQTLASAPIASAANQTPQRRVSNPIIVRKTMPTTRRIRVVRHPLPGQDKAIKSVAKGRVLTTNTYVNKDMKVFTNERVRTNTPNLFEN